MGKNTFQDYCCDDYFDDEQYLKGIWVEKEQNYLIMPTDEAYENSEADILVVGRPGVDGIEFGFRKGREGVWAHYPINGEYKYMAENLADLARCWLSGELSV